MGLEHGDQAPWARARAAPRAPPRPRSGGARSRRRSRPRRARPLALEPPQHPRERCERRGQLVRLAEPGELERGQRAAGVEQVVLARDGQVERRARGPRRRSERPSARRRRVEGRPRRPARAPDAGPAKSRKASISSARDDQREWWSSSTFVTTAISGQSCEEAGVGLVGLGDHPLGPSTQPALVGSPSGPAAGQLAAEEERAAPTGGPGEHPGGGRLAVGSGDRDQPASRAQLGEQLAAMDHPLAALAGDRRAPGCPRRSRSRRRRRRRRAPAMASCPTRASMPGGGDALEVGARGAIAARHIRARGRGRPARGRSSRPRRSR